jgi:hypothetical protein
MEGTRVYRHTLEGDNIALVIGVQKLYSHTAGGLSITHPSGMAFGPNVDEDVGVTSRCDSGRISGVAITRIAIRNESVSQ